MKQTIYILLFFSLFISCDKYSKSGRRGNSIANNSHKEPNEIKKPNENEPVKSSSGKTIVTMRQDGGVYYVPVEINQVPMEFIFDTGASSISISEVEALYLFKNGKLSQEDVKGTAQFSDANGDISEGTIIVLKTVKIGNKTLSNVEANVVHNLQAPLLFGQTAMQRFGKISIDYNKATITLE